MTVILTARRTAIFLGACDTCARPVRATDEQTPGTYTRLPCPQCGQPVRAERLYATTTGEPCHGACMSALGPRCSCGCGGINHGGLWAQRGEATETALAAYRARIATQHAQAEQRAQAQRARRAAAFQAWADEHRDIVDFLTGDTADPLAEHRNGFLDDMTDLIDRQRPLTPGQAAAVRRCIQARQRFAERKAAEQAAARPAPTGDALTVEGDVISTRIDDNRYGPGATYKMLIKCDGWKVWSTIPANLINQTHKISDLKGKRVRLTAAVQPSRDDPTFGIAKRPRKAELVTPNDSPK